MRAYTDNVWRLVLWRERWANACGHYPDEVAHLDQIHHGIHFPIKGKWPYTPVRRDQQEVLSG